MDELLKWINAQESSKLEFVEIGLDTLDPSIIEKLKQHKEHIRCNYQPVSLSDDKCMKQQEIIHMSQAYQETYPYWSGPHSSERNSLE